MATEAGVEGMDSLQRENVCTSTTPIVLSQDQPGRPACLVQRPAQVRGLEPLDAGSWFASSLKIYPLQRGAFRPEKHG